jgi:hypothetical protein
MYRALWIASIDRRMVQSPAEPSADIDAREHASVMQLLSFTIRTLSAVLLAVALLCVVDGPTLAYGIVATVLLTMLLAAVWLRGVGRQLSASARGDDRLSLPDGR